jgi:hypothetical protein
MTSPIALGALLYYFSIAICCYCIIGPSHGLPRRRRCVACLAAELCHLDDDTSGSRVWNTTAVSDWLYYICLSIFAVFIVL